MNGYGTTHEFFTVVSAGTLCGLTAATFVVTNAIGAVSGGKRQYIGLVVSEFLTIGLAAIDQGDALSYLAAIEHGVVVNLGALGLSSVCTVVFESEQSRESSDSNESSLAVAVSQRRFLRRWI